MTRGPGAAILTVCALALAGGFAAAGDGAPAPEPAELLVRFEPGAARGAALASIGATLVERLPLQGLVRVRLPSGAAAAGATAALRRRADVRYADPNRRLSLFATPNDPSYLSGSLWGLSQANDADIDAPEAWEETTGSDSVTVAVVDTGIDYAHPDLSLNIWANQAELSNGLDDDGNGLTDDLRGWDFFGTGGYTQDNDPNDPHGHGTHVAGTIGARGNNGVGVTGVNWSVKLLPLRAGDEDGLSESAIVSSFAYACAKGAQVVNGSFGGTYSQAIHDAIAGCPSTLFVFAAGNSSSNNDALPVYPCNDSAPNVICVAATRQNDELAGFSSYGVTSVDLAAPGQTVNSTYPSVFGSYAALSGTSMATPHVAGVAALVRADRPQLTVKEARRAILLSTDPLPSLTGVVATGGRLNAHRALGQEVVPPTGLVTSSATHGGGWTNNQAVVVSWAGATDANGIDGYSYAFSPLPAFVPDEVKDAEETTTTLTTTMSDGEHWFHVRARDGAGNWGETVHFGPIRIDTFAPVRPVPSSPSHRVGGASADRTVVAAWSGGSDSASGVDGFSFSWSQGREAAADLTKDVEETISRTTSPQLAVGAWWFNIRARDNAGNWSDTQSVGPFSIRGGPTACAVPRLRGLTLVAAKRLLVKRGCSLGRVSRVRSRRVARGRVVAQRRAPGLRLARGTRIAVVLSRGRR